MRKEDRKKMSHIGTKKIHEKNEEEKILVFHGFFYIQKKFL